MNASNGLSRNFSVTFRSECTVSTGSDCLPSYASMMDVRMGEDEKSEIEDSVVVPFDMVLMVCTHETTLFIDLSLFEYVYLQ